jgi:hypothetical protein
VQGRHPQELLTDEQRVFAECVEDILQSVPDLRYALVLDPAHFAGRDANMYAQFLIATNPAHDLTVAIELTDKAFVLRVNGIRFARKRGLATRFEWWVERRCKDVERMVAGSLRLTHQNLMNMPVTSTLEIGGGDAWRKFGSRENGLVAVLGFLVPYGFVLSTKKEVVYEYWCHAGEDQ